MKTRIRMGIVGTTPIFYPEYKGWFLWNRFEDVYQSFYSVEQAQEFIKSRLNLEASMNYHNAMDSKYPKDQ